MADIAWPDDLGVSTITGRILWMEGDTADADRNPDLTPALNATVTFECSVPEVRYTGTEGPALFVKRVTKATTDAEGYLCSLDSQGGAGERGVPLPATDSTTLKPTGFTYRVSINTGTGNYKANFSIKAPAGETVDLAQAMPVSPSGGTAIVVDTSIALRAETAADRAEAAAVAAEEYIPEVEWSGTSIVIDGVVGPDLKGETGPPGGASLEATEIGEAHLDTVQLPGSYSQSYSSYASVAQGYPGNIAGRLLVLANPLDSQITQIYIEFATSSLGMYVRNYYNSWSQWYPLGAGGGDEGGAGDVILRGTIPEGTNINSITEPGFYSVPSVNVAGTLVNWPTIRGGMLVVASNADTGVTSQDILAHVSSTAAPERYVRTKLLTSTSTWSPWSTPEWVKGRIPIGTNVDTFRTMGLWVVASATDATGLPGSGSGTLEVAFIVGAGISMQRFTERVANDEIRVWHRYTLTTGGWGGIAWDLLNPPQEAGGGGDGAFAIRSDVQASDHATRVEIAASRRGGSIGTDGVPVFMWRFDHWLVTFRDKILPILQEFDLPGTLNVNYDNLSNEANGAGSIPWAEVQDWNQYSGIEIANHGATHTNVNTAESIYHEVVEGRRLLEEAMPRVAVETWQEHGSAYLVATDIEGDKGLDLGRTPECFTESYAGRLVMAEHAIVEGKFGSFYPPLTGKPQIGQSHYSMDRQTAAEAIDTIEFAQKAGRGLTGYTHPGLMDGVNVGGSIFYATYNEDGSVDFEGTHYATEAEFRTAQELAGNIVHMPTKDFRAICQWLATERDAGRLMIMTAAGGGFADKSHNRRENLLFTSLSDWSYTSGWTETGAGDSQVWTSDESAIRLTQGMLLYTRFGWAMGAAHELLVHAKADVEITLTLRMEKMGDAQTWATQKEHVVPGDGVLRPYRLPLTLPRDRSITSMTAFVGGPSMEIHGPPLLAAI